MFSEASKVYTDGSDILRIGLIGCGSRGCEALNGGGIALWGAGAKISNCIIGGNIAKTEMGSMYYHVANGGGIWVQNGGLIEKCDIYGNFAYDSIPNPDQASHEIYHSAGGCPECR